jgi:hypothetical protein
MLEGQRGGEVLLAGGPGFRRWRYLTSIHLHPTHHGGRLCAGWLGR